MEKRKKRASSELHKYYIKKVGQTERRRKVGKLIGILILAGTVILSLFIINLIF